MESAVDLYWFHNDTPTVWTQILRDIDTKYKLDIELKLTEPAFFLPEATGNRPVVLRGRCTLIVKRPLKIKQVVVTLDGFSYVRWRPNRVRDMGSVVNCALTLFNSKKDSKAQFQFQAKESKKPTTSVTEVEVPQKKFKPLRKVVDKLHLRSQRTEPDVESKCFSPGKYSYDFEMILHSGLPESTFVEGAIVRYHLKASVKCHSKLRGMYKTAEIEAVRCPSDAYVEDSVGGHWSLLLPGIMDVDITLPRKGIALEDCLPVLFQYRGHNNTKFHKLDVYLVEDIRYYSRNGAKAGRAPSKKIFLYKTRSHHLRPDAHGEQELESSEEDLDIFEAKSTSFPMSSGICNTPDGENEGAPVGETVDLHMDLPMPKCKSHRGAPDFRYMHSDTKLSSLEVGHSLEFQIWIFINNKPTPQDFVRWVPLTLRSCYAHPGNAILPPYSEEPLPVYSSSLDAPVSTTDHER
ncbi:hypothetical protein CNMCM6106_004613 [Aspergillus hiratsukae]|uniref:Arrestin C-terminal-like domain-containing protein n=1 Tax=Aspergillus hiratsukae TaxID=1194566 RepID=A0A8H6PJI3_9EURO|nr:hypothetical protein CNMCM6106_004613 [Aspergillus hiratsukae]